MSHPLAIRFIHNHDKVATSNNSDILHKPDSFRGRLSKLSCFSINDIGSMNFTSRKSRSGDQMSPESNGIDQNYGNCNVISREPIKIPHQISTYDEDMQKAYPIWYRVRGEHDLHNKLASNHKLLLAKQAEKENRNDSMKIESDKKSVRFRSFVETVSITSYRDHPTYKDRIWCSKNEQKRNIERNKIEYISEGRNWRAAIEEEHMWLDIRSGLRIHPIHILIQSNMSRFPKSRIEM